MATPHVAGIAALLLQANPSWTPVMVKSAIKDNAVNLGYDINTQGAGFTDVKRILDNEGNGALPAGVPQEAKVESTFAPPSSSPIFAPGEKRTVIIQLDEDAITQKVAQAPAGMSDDSLIPIIEQQRAITTLQQNSL